jgi:hypothetical protein
MTLEKFKRLGSACGFFRWAGSHSSTAGTMPAATDGARAGSVVRCRKRRTIRPDEPEDSLLWHSDEGKEYSQAFARPQSWKELPELASRDDRARVPKVLQDDPSFAFLFSLVFQHRTQLSLIKHLDDLMFDSIEPDSGVIE